MVEEKSRLAMKFSVTGLPDTAGLRIRSTNPIGLYISSRDAEAAQWYFETKIVELATIRKLLVPKRGAGVRLLEGRLDWSIFIISGTGEVVIRTMSLEETREMLRVSTPTVLPPVQKLVTDWWKDSNGKKFCIVHDPGDMIDEWLVRCIDEDLELERATIN